MRCRQMTEDDSLASALLLTEGFRERDLSYWTRAIAALRERDVPGSYPRYGFVLESEGRLVGILLTIFTMPPSGEQIRCNLSSWYVEPRYRDFAALLMNAAVKPFRDVVFVNVSAAPHTHPTIEASGFARYADGIFCALPSLSAPVRGLKIVRRAPSATQTDLLSAHARYGCISLHCVVGEETYPFVFIKRHFARGRIPCAQLIYCQHVDHFVRFAGPLGRFLLRYGMVLVTMDANQPMPGLVGRYFHDKMPKYFRGGMAPRLGDLAYTEMVLFGP